jgi:hypothetical protein
MTFEEIIQEKAKSHAYMSGADSFIDKLPCKFPNDDKYFKEWTDGYLDAEMLHRMIHG